jgi:Fanconi-associated nuclease 1
MSLLDYWDTLRPSAKRRKTTREEPDTGDEKDTPDSSDSPLIKPSETPLPVRLDYNPTPAEAGDEGAGDGSEIPSNSQTELESSLPYRRTIAQSRNMKLRAQSMRMNRTSSRD